MAEEQKITRLLHLAASGEEQATEELVAAVYGDLERVARRQMRRRYGGELAGVTLEPAALVNETLLKLLQSPREFENRRHFYGFATKVMLRVLIDYQRARQAEKRGGDRVRVTLSGLRGAGSTEIAEASDLADVLERLEELDPRKAEVVKLRVFWGLEMKEIAELLETSLSTVDRDWKFSRNWLAWQLAGGEEDDAGRD